ncbi:MAG: NADH:flavin oxidoreductase [Actinobacteria bacterium]|nr:NADH:flavin oxidoreductase [Actinomycetota bacterium]
MTYNHNNSPVFSPFALDGMTLRNRTIRSGCFEGMSQEGTVTERLIDHHRRLAAGGIGMTTVSYCSVSEDGRAFGHELWMRTEILPGLRRLTDAVHAEGAAVSIQLGHCGFFASPSVIDRRPFGASPKFCLFRLSYCDEMSEEDIEKKTDDFVRAARLARQAGFDAVEIHAGHGYLLSQFLSPWTNRRGDRYGGSLENRVRFPAEVVRRVRAEMGGGYPILVKMNQCDGMRGGLELDESIEVARSFEAAGAGALVPSCGFTAKTPFHMLRGGVPVREMVRAQSSFFYRLGLSLFGRTMVQRYPFEPLFLLEGARRIRDAVSIPVGYIGGVLSRTDMETLVDEGFAFVQLGRATIRDPDFVRRLEHGELDRSDCDQCNRCIATMSVEGVRCVTADLATTDRALSQRGTRLIRRRLVGEYHSSVANPKEDHE